MCFLTSNYWNETYKFCHCCSNINYLFGAAGNLEIITQPGLPFIKIEKCPSLRFLFFFIFLFFFNKVPPRFDDCFLLWSMHNISQTVGRISVIFSKFLITFPLSGLKNKIEKVFKISKNIGNFEKLTQNRKFGNTAKI